MNHGKTLKAILRCLCAGFLVIAAHAHAETMVTQSVNDRKANVGGAMTLPSGAQLALNVDGAFESLDTGEEATDTFRYTIADGNGVTATIAMNIDGSTDPFTTRGRQLIGPDGKPMALKGYRVGIEEVSSGFASEAKFRERAANGIGGNAQAFEIWWTRNKGPSEPQPSKVGVYNKDQLGMYLEAMRGAVRAGMYVIPSIRVSFDQAFSDDALKNNK